MLLPRIVGHRGAAAVAPENTLAGFRAAAVAGARWVEFDVRLAGDGGTVVIHDATVDRTTDGKGAVADMQREALSRLDAGAWFGGEFAGERIPTLTATLRECARLGLGANVELKVTPAQAAPLAAAVSRAIANLGDVLPILLSSFSRPALDACRAEMPSLPRGFLAERLPDDWRATVAQLGCVSVHLDAAELTAESAVSVKDAGHVLAVYTVNDLETARRLLTWGVDTIITDHPGALAPLQTGGLMH